MKIATYEIFSRASWDCSYRWKLFHKVCSWQILFRHYAKNSVSFSTLDAKKPCHRFCKWTASGLCECSYGDEGRTVIWSFCRSACSANDRVHCSFGSGTCCEWQGKWALNRSWSTSDIELVPLYRKNKTSVIDPLHIRNAVKRSHTRAIINLAALQLFYIESRLCNICHQ